MIPHCTEATIATITAMLDALAHLQDEYARMGQTRQDLADAALPDAVKMHLSAIDAEYAPVLQGYRDEMGQLEAHIKAAVLAYGQSVKGTGIQAVYGKGRVRWDDAFLQGYAATHEELLQGRIEGEPSVSLRTIKG